MLYKLFYKIIYSFYLEQRITSWYNNYILKLILELLENEFKTDNIKKITSDLTKDDIESWDSFSHMGLILNIEEQFNISIGPTEIADITSVMDIFKIVKNKLNWYVYKK